MSKSILYIMGVSGSGKSTIGKMLSEKTGIPFFDGDDFHPPENIQKMASGHPLNDQDRKAWLEELNRLAKNELKKSGAIIACSALKKTYRKSLKNGLGSNCYFIFLKGDFETIKKRLDSRGKHFMSSALLQSQFETLQPPDNALVFDIENKPSEIISAILKTLPL